LAAGHLPNLDRLRKQGAWGKLKTTDSETAWTSFLTGVGPKKSGFPSHYRVARGDYTCAMPGTYDFERYPPFYATGGDDFRVVAFDIPQVRLVEGLRGVQVLSYGAHAAFTDRVSEPPELLPRLIETYGDHPAADGKDYARFWRRNSMEKLVNGLHVGAKRRAAICRDLMQSEQWDLFIAVFGEVHSVSHYLWHTTQRDHPLHEHFGSVFDEDQMLAVAKTVDDAVGEVLAAAPRNANIMLFSQEGMVANTGDMPGSLFLPELLYRYSFPGQRGIDPNPESRVGENEPPSPPILHPRSRAWFRKAWTMKHDDNPVRNFLRRHLPLEAGWFVEKIMGNPGGPGHPWDFEVKYQPAVWYSNDWPRMKAFALPTASQQGKIRINLRGREASGVVAIEEYDSVCAEIAQHLHALRNGRTGAPLVREITMPLKAASATDPNEVFADLIVDWQPEPADVIDSPTYGRFGPVQYMRTGGHVESGFVVMAGPDIPAGSSFADGHVLDLAPSILNMIGAPLPDYLDGRPLKVVPPRQHATANWNMAWIAEWAGALACLAN
jgi:predicted AlkP superfamily phosphohydrolase/phosphomutase